MHSSNLQKIYGFDYLRVIFCIAVLCLHTNIPSLILKYQTLYNIIVYNVFYLAVPIFFQLALILFFLNRQKNKDYFWKKRFFKIIKLYIFWGILSSLFSFFTQKEMYLNYLRNLKNINNIMNFIITDGYSNPFYYFFSLLFVTILAELFAFYIDRAKINNQLICYSLLIYSCIIVFLLPLSVMLMGGKFAMLPQAVNPLNFTPYVFSSFLISNSLSQNKPNDNSKLNIKQIWILIILFIFFALFEWKYISHPLIWGGEMNPLPVYSRVSLVFGAWLITLISTKITSEPHFLIKLFSDLSLGIYCLHTFLGLLLIKFFPLTPNTDVLLLFFLMIVLATLLTKFLKNFQIFKELI
ncbi:acyltransferase [Hassallia byssoidea VB512170]|uniref:Acyltransferase n=1 Tax=Hassallia byssoidea VB512170 TaxID=1304833 RepID=A0A846H6K1_9CYAN|nr:acyltransferase [Hassalia byssoidea]NEU72171.1 acyltransferase [Hassalia byssoidea VB512170]